MVLGSNRCLSSRLTTELLKFRNPPGEEGWNLSPIYNLNRSRLGKLIVAEVGVALLVLTATIETIVYSIFSLSSAFLLPFTSTPFNHSWRLLKSSGFTVFWNIGNFLDNPFHQRVFTQESIVRSFFSQRKDPIEGVPFFNTYMLAEGQMEKAAKDLIIECDPEIFPFVLTRTIYLFVFGDLREAPLPYFFSISTSTRILLLREKYSELQDENIQTQIAQLEQLMRDHSLFNEEENNTILTELKRVGGGELRGGLVTVYWGEAIRPISQRQAVAIPNVIPRRQPPAAIPPRQPAVLPNVIPRRQPPVIMPRRLPHASANAEVRVLTKPLIDGIQFFKNYMLDRSQVSESSRRLIIERNPQTSLFVLTRSVYIYVFGDQRQSSLPLFLKQVTQAGIEKLRNIYGRSRVEGLGTLVHSIDQFNQSDSLILNQLKTIASLEMAESLLIQVCWPRACQNQ